MCFLPLQTESDDDVEVDVSVGFEADIMDESKALANELKEALEQDKHKEVICNNVEQLEMEDAGKHKTVNEVIRNIEKTEEVTEEAVEMDTNCEDVSQDMAEVQEAEVMEQPTRPGQESLGRGNFLKRDDTLSIATENHFALSEELGQLSAFETSASAQIYQVGIYVAFFLHFM